VPPAKAVSAVEIWLSSCPTKTQPEAVALPTR
jgi:hypothetical protein